MVAGTGLKSPIDIVFRLVAKAGGPDYLPHFMNPKLVKERT
jgi:hypothetical protein